jgi:hypothetical protein
MDLNSNQTLSNFIRSKKDLPELKKFKIKYNFYGFDESNNFHYINFLRFEMKFELKIREASRIKIEGNLMEFLLETSILDETSTKEFCLHLITHLTHDEELEVQPRNSLTWS